MSGQRERSRLQWQEHAIQSPETVIMKKQKRKAIEFHRSNTVSSFSTSSTPGSSNHRGQEYSPLERFRDAKSEISRAFFHIQNCLEQAQAFLKETVCNGGEKKIKPLVDRVKGIEEILDRDHMKVAFFGRTSNGKSTVVNALLQEEVLPTGVGHITSCFCSVRGVSSSEGYVLVPGSEKKNSVTLLQKVIHRFHQDRLSENSLVKVYWPHSKCPLLQEDVELIDSPGVNLNDPVIDDCINEHCLDADVFVLVSDATAILSIAEETFFHCVSQRLSQPNIFILINCWDQTAQDSELLGDETNSTDDGSETMEGLRKQHLETAVKFLSQELKVTDRDTAARRVYFISAKEMLHQRIREHNEEEDMYRGFAYGHHQRMVEFEQFEEQLKECLSSSAIHTKFKKHHQRGTDILTELDKLLQEEECKILDRSKSVGRDLEEAESYKKRLESEGDRLKDQCEAKLSSTMESVKKEFAKAIGSVIQQFTDIASEYNGDFDLQHLDSYKAGLFEHVDASLRQMLQELGSSTLSSLHRDACADITGSYQRVLEVGLMEAQQRSSQTRAPEISYVLSCAVLCEDFSEDLNFHFSFGVDRLKKWVSPVFNFQRQLSQLLSVIPSDFVFPLSVAFGGLLLTQLFSWRILLPSVAIYCGIYAYEKFTWTKRSQEQALRNQFVAHLEYKFRLQARAIRASYLASLDRGLRGLVGSLDGVLGNARREQDRKIGRLREEAVLLSHLKSQAHGLRNNVRHLRTHLETFKDNYLDDID